MNDIHNIPSIYWIQSVNMERYIHPYISPPIDTNFKFSINSSSQIIQSRRSHYAIRRLANTSLPGQVAEFSGVTCNRQGGEVHWTSIAWLLTPAYPLSPTGRAPRCQQTYLLYNKMNVHSIKVHSFCKYYHK